MEYSDKIDLLIDVAERYADKAHNVPHEQRKDHSPARKNKGWQATYSERLAYLKRHMPGVKNAVDCGYKPPRKTSGKKIPVIDDSFFKIDVPCYNAADGCKNTVTVTVENGDKIPVKVCDYCKAWGAPSHRVYGMPGESAAVMGPCGHSAAM